MLQFVAKTIATAQSVKKYQRYLEIYLSFKGTWITLHNKGSSIKEASIIDFNSKVL